jgi:hypothetical protein
MKKEDIFEFHNFIKEDFFEFMIKRADYSFNKICSSKSCEQFIKKSPRFFVDWIYEQFKIIVSLVKVMYSQEIIKNKLKVPNPKEFPNSYSYGLSWFDKESGVWKTNIFEEKFEAYNLIDVEKCPYRKRLGKIMLDDIYSWTNVSKHPFKGVELDEKHRVKELTLTSSNHIAIKTRKKMINNYSQALSDIDYIYKNK